MRISGCMRYCTLSTFTGQPPFCRRARRGSAPSCSSLPALRLHRGGQLLRRSPTSTALHRRPHVSVMSQED